MFSLFLYFIIIFGTLIVADGVTLCSRDRCRTGWQSQARTVAFRCRWPPARASPAAVLSQVPRPQARLGRVPPSPRRGGGSGPGPWTSGPGRGTPGRCCWVRGRPLRAAGGRQTPRHGHLVGWRRHRGLFQGDVFPAETSTKNVHGRRRADASDPEGLWAWKTID